MKPRLSRRSNTASSHQTVATPDLKKDQNVVADRTLEAEDIQTIDMTARIGHTLMMVNTDAARVPARDQNLF